ncbi:class I SAM-dependent methyltransferase [Pseudomonas mendocina]|uniref:class I SAM-dependent methyltransferase n=1 Tax=Ectopseudomonas mendocina TaxID=300 RepID=UPI0023DC8AAF|nr:class I SAM-dependent methyltransferase [Pseudomonas mendocina]MDF2074722.1 class I SAM-dependent methyltransferase [Pseudomonas mendocina]
MLEQTFDAPQTLALLRLGTLLRARRYHFVTPTPLTHQRVNQRPDNARAKDLRDVFGWSRPFADGTLDEEIVAAMREAQVLQPHALGWISQVRFSSLGDELYVHSPFPTEESDAVFFGPDTYRFTRLLRDYLAHANQPLRRIADIGCGAGPGAITAAQLRPGAEVMALDINHKALAMTAVNARQAGIYNLRVQRSDLLRDVPGQFDLIIANPPYMLDSHQRTYRHGGGKHGAGLSLAIFDTAMERLAPGGTLLLYTGVAIFAGEDPFLNAIRLSLRDTGWDWDYQEIDPDVFGEELQKPEYSQAERIACVALRLTYQPSLCQR